MDLHAPPGLDAATLERVRALTAAHTTLERIVRWGYAQDPPVDILDVVVQDEFTHDVIVPTPAIGVVLVYDST